ncbi:hypothetical protein [Ottowia sp. VDI28]|uniref:hypothetical protein n=1 Tax=Ottowia sp. VDI28 TaxID=3133968 RepID=UPI003C2D657A
MNTNTNATLAQRLRDACSSVRSKSYPLSDLIPLMQQAADALSTAAQPPAGKVMVPIELAERVQETMGEFLMDHGWRQQDMDTSDDFGALLAAAPKAAKAEPVQQHGTSAWKDYAQHLEYCRSCAEDSVGSCSEGVSLKSAAESAPVQPEVPLTADDLREPKNGANWRVEWWNELCRMMLPADMSLDSYRSYKNGTFMFTLKARPLPPAPKE